jgi:hypothetical protein
MSGRYENVMCYNQMCAAFISIIYMFIYMFIYMSRYMFIYMFIDMCT